MNGFFWSLKDCNAYSLAYQPMHRALFLSARYSFSVLRIIFLYLLDSIDLFCKDVLCWCSLSSTYTYRVGQKKTAHYTLVHIFAVHIFAKYW